nr:hypothetical protein [Staphylococcus auricularis]
MRVGGMSEVMGGSKKEGVIVFMIGGMIGVVGGGVGFDGRKKLVVLEFGEGMKRMLEVGVVGGGIGVGVLFGEEVGKLYIVRMKGGGKEGG